MSDFYLQHLRELKNIGIIQGTIEGSRISYCISPVRWAEINGQFNVIFLHRENVVKKICLIVSQYCNNINRNEIIRNQISFIEGQ
jgi:hypothetical protein